MEFLRQSSATAGCVESISHALKSEYKGLVYLAGLFHDIGEALLAISMPRVYDDIQAVALSLRKAVPLVEPTAIDGGNQRCYRLAVGKID